MEQFLMDNEYTRKEKEEAIQYRLPFGGGSGAGVNITTIEKNTWANLCKSVFRSWCSLLRTT